MADGSTATSVTMPPNRTRVVQALTAPDAGSKLEDLLSSGPEIPSALRERKWRTSWFWAGPPPVRSRPPLRRPGRLSRPDSPQTTTRTVRSSQIVCQECPGRPVAATARSVAPAGPRHRRDGFPPGGTGGSRSHRGSRRDQDGSGTSDVGPRGPRASPLSPRAPERRARARPRSGGRASRPASHRSGPADARPPRWSPDG